MEGVKIVQNCYNSSCLLVMVMIMSLLLMLISGGNSEVYTVGDGDEWSSGINFLDWSKKYNFSVGDILVFKYSKAQHNAYEVNEAAFKSCDPNDGVLAKYESGNDRVELKEAKKYWFICDVEGHCFGGMRFGITVNEANPVAKNNNNNTTTSPDHKSSCSYERMGFLSYILALGVFFFA